VWVTQMNHLSMKIGKFSEIDARDWPSLQANATCNVEGGVFNDWFTGHLNYQIEHHIFPTMPRHNYSKVAPMVKNLFEKNGKGDMYVTKTLIGAFSDIVSSLKTYGECWREAYSEM
jgi:fatty acid desaturase